MTDAIPDEDATLFPKTAGERLREAREAQGLSLDEIAARTRVPVRQLGAIEASDFAALPSITYSVGFAKAYARAVGLDEVAIGRDVRGQNGQIAAPRREAEIYTIDEPTARVPTRGLALGALGVALLVVIGAALWFGTTLFRDGADTPPAVASATENTVPEAPVAAPSAPHVATSGPVVLTATDEVWLKVYTADKTLFQNTLKPGDRYEVPADAVNPLINVGRPDKLQVTVGGAAVAPLGDGRVAIKDVGVSAAALTARGAPQATPSAGATPVGAPARPAGRRPTPTRERRTAPATTSGALNIAAPAPVAPEPTVPAPAASPAP